MTTTKTLDPFTRAYIECALWSSTDDDGEPLDDRFSVDDIAPETLARMATDCLAFQAAHGAAIDAADVSRSHGDKWASAGHDFWLTRNGHGAGFWDGDWTPEPAAEALDKAARSFGQFDLYLDNDGSLWGVPA